MSVAVHPQPASDLKAAFYADLARGVATMDAACRWIAAAFDEQARADMLAQHAERNRKMGEVA